MSDPREELTPEELAAYDRESVARYRAMTGMDLPLAERAARARRNERNATTEETP